MAHGEQVDYLRLNLVRILILVHKYVLEVVRPVIAYLGLFRKHPLPVNQQVVVVHRVAFELARLIDAVNALYLSGERLEVRIVLNYCIAQHLVAVVCEADYVADDFGFRKAASLRVYARLLNRSVQQVFCVFRVEYREVLPVAD